METAISYTDFKTAWVSSDQRGMINRVRKLKEQYPDEVKILNQPETNDGCIYCTVPPAWITIRPPVKLNLTEEQRQQRSAQLRAMRNNERDVVS